MNIEMLKRKLKTRPKEESPIRTGDLLSSGSTLVNLACTGRWQGAFPKGKYIFFVGDSSSGKTFFTLTCLAEAASNPAFKDYRLIYDAAEDGALMSMKKFFGDRMAKRLEPAATVDGIPTPSYDVDEFYYNVDDAKRVGKPFIYILDSMDVLTSKYEQTKFNERKKASRSGTKAKGDFGDGKAKKNASNLRSVVADLRDSGSILLIINQTRDNIAGGPFDPKKTRSGGHALTFYATVELWTSKGKTLTKEVRGKKRQIGMMARVRIKRSRITGKERTVEIPIFHSYGIDDTLSCIDFLVDEGHWKKSGRGVIKAKELMVTGRRETLADIIEKDDNVIGLRRIVGKVWQEIEDACRITRRPRYG